MPRADFLRGIFTFGCLVVVAGVARHAGAEEALPAAVPPASLAAAHSALKFHLFAPPRKEDASASTLLAQARRVVAALEPAARLLHADALARLPRFEVYVADAEDSGAMSSATGRIALNDAFTSLRPTDDWLAFVIAREMAHVIAGHHAENSAASMLTSLVMNLMIPGTGLVKTALTLAGSQAAAISGRARQLGEADALALRLLAAAGFGERDVALSLAVGPGPEQLGATSWARAFTESARGVIARVRGAPAQSASPVATTPIDAVQVPIATLPNPMLLSVAPREPERSPAREIVLRGRPSGMPGMLLLGDQVLPARRLE